MREVDQFDFYLLGQFIHPLEMVDVDNALKQHFVTIFHAANRLEILLSGSLVELTVSHDAVKKLTDLLRSVVPANLEDIGDFEKPIKETSPAFGFQLKEALRAFEIVFAAEVRQVPSYIVDRKGLYHTRALIRSAEEAFVQASRDAIPEAALKDFREAGRCLAFELPTAAAFHVMRSTERTLRKWHQLVKGLPDENASPEMTVCVNELNASGANKKVTRVIDQIRELHRNPTMHPEIFLSVEEALALFDVAKSAIGSMAMEIAAVEGGKAE